MNCPYCGKEMTKGWVQSARKVLFTTTKKEGTFIIGNRNDVVLTANNFVGPSCAAYLCDTCKKVIIDYAEKTE
ncbi:MAG: hypothetical protein E7223_05300 [Clostridiales bacterium]|nr:hypothetical protein [Clostridiales bacterium]